MRHKMTEWEVTQKEIGYSVSYRVNGVYIKTVAHNEKELVGMKNAYEVMNDISYVDELSQDEIIDLIKAGILSNKDVSEWYNNLNWSDSL